MTQGPSDSAARLVEVRAGTVVEVRTRYQAGQWAHGYQVVEVLDVGYRIMRLGSREVLPEVFGPADVRLGDDQ